MAGLHETADELQAMIDHIDMALLDPISVPIELEDAVKIRQVVRESGVDLTTYRDELLGATYQAGIKGKLYCVL